MHMRFETPNLNIRNKLSNSKLASSNLDLSYRKKYYVTKYIET